MPNRRWLVPVSISAHLAAGLGLYAGGIWQIERVEAAHAPTAIGTPLSPPEAAGGPLKANKLQVDQREVPKVLVQPEQVVHLEPITHATTDDATAGTGSGSGAGSGSGSGDPTSTGHCLDNCDDGGIPKLPPPPPPHIDQPQPQVLPPNALSALWVSGDRDIHPPDTVVTQMTRDGKDHAVGVFKLCLSTGGDVTSVAMLKSTGYDPYDHRIAAAIHNWRYRPFMVDNKPAPVCSSVRFEFTIR